MARVVMPIAIPYALNTFPYSPPSAFARRKINKSEMAMSIDKVIDFAFFTLFFSKSETFT